MSNSSVVFPYRISFSRQGDLNTFPVADVKIEGPNKSGASFLCLIDSGATISALPRIDVEVLGVNLEDGIPYQITGVHGKPLRGWVHTFSISMGGNSFEAPFVILDSKTSPRILGRKDIFSKFAVVFDEEDKRTGLLHKDSRDVISVKKLLNKLSKM